MKKRLLSMLMAVLMIASLVPATALAAGTTADDEYLINIKADAAAKQPGITVKANTDGTYTAKVTPFLTKSKDQCKPACTNLVTKELITATCDQKGLTVYYCGTCGKEMMKPVEADKLHHDSNFTVVVAPTCKAGGWGYAVCTKCGTAFYVDADTDFEAYIEKGEKESATAYAERTAAAAKLFEQLKHDYVAVTADVKNDKGETVAYAAKAATHAEFVTGGELDGAWAPLAVDKKTGHFVSRYVGETGANRPLNTNAVEFDAAGWKAGTVCSLCGTVENEKGVAERALNAEHADKIKVLEAGYIPYTDKDGDKIDGVTAKFYCAVCNKTFGGTEIPYDEFWSVKEAADPAIGTVKTYEATDGVVYTIVNGDLVKATVKEAKAATCCDVGYTGDTIVYTASGVADKDGKVPGVWMLSKKGEDIKKADHHYVAVESIAATCDKPGTNYYGVYKCDNVVKTENGKDILCSDINKTVGEGYKLDKINSGVNGLPVAALGHSVVEKVLVEATCQHTGLSALYCTVCNKYVEDEADNNAYVTAKVNHVAADELANVVEATCTEAGYSGDQVCKWCGETLKKGEEVKALGHTPEDVAAVEATCTETGLTAGSKCSVCGEVLTAQEVVPALGHKYENGVCTVCGEKDPNYVEPVAPEFKDADSIKDYAKDAVAWAAKEGVVKGDDQGNFNPTADITRQDFVTMLWRLNGEVASDKELTFGDKADIKDYAQTAVAWAVENGYITGRDNGNFDPAAKITRAEIVAILNRVADNAKAEKAASFTDIGSHWAKDAIAWAAEAGIVNGVGNDLFAPNDNATRQDTVVMLYKFVNLK